MSLSVFYLCWCRRLSGCVVLLAALVGGCASPPGSVDVSTSIDRVAVARDVAAHLNFLASDDMGGRETGTLEGQITAHYVAAALHAAGLDPGGDDGSYLQRYPLESSSLDEENARFILRGGGEEHVFDFREDFQLRRGSGDMQVTAPLVYAGYGITAPDQEWDDLKGLPVEGKVVVVLDGHPEGRNDLASSGQWWTKSRTLEERGAAGLIIALTKDDDRARGTLEALDRRSRSGRLHLPTTEESQAFPFVYLTSLAADDFFRAAGTDLEKEVDRAEAGSPGPLPVDDMFVELVAPHNKEVFFAMNACGLLEGSDPDLRDEVIVLSAHMDHVGRDEDGAIYNGADDNASGTTTLLSLARSMATRGAPRRSVLFLLVSGEEKGLLGSAWWVRQPTLDLSRVVANVNIDMVGRNASDVIGATPSPDHPDYNTLVTRAAVLAPPYGLDVVWDVGPSEDTLERVDSYFHRSDHANFSAAGIPVVFFFSGVHEDYHQPTDTVEKINQEKLVRLVGFLERFVTDVGNRSEPPQRIGSTEEGLGRRIGPALLDLAQSRSILPRPLL